MNETAETYARRAPPTLLPGSRVLVTGATGFTGSVLTRKLCAMGVHVRAIARPGSNRASLDALPIEWVEGQVYDLDVVQHATADVHYIFHVAAAYREAGLDDEIYRRVHVDSTRLLAQAVEGLTSFRRMIHISTVGVHGHVEHPPADENTPFNPGDVYQRTKAEAEQWLHVFAAAHGLPYTVIRPAAIYGPGDRRLLKIFRMATWPLFPLLGHSPGLYHLIHVEDLTDAIIEAATHPAALCQTFIVGNPAPDTLEGIARIVADELGYRVRVIRLPAGPFFMAADLCEALCKPLHLKPPIYRRRVAFFTKDRAFDTRKVHTRLGFRCHFTSEEGLRQTARWYREHHWL